MDTREKIVDLARAAQITADLRKSGAKWKLVTGYFDVLTPDRVRDLQASANGGRLVAIVLDPQSPLLASRARAELAASLRMIDCVILLGNRDVEDAIRELQPDEVIRAEAADERYSQALIEHVNRRNKA